MRTSNNQYDNESCRTYFDQYLPDSYNQFLKKNLPEEELPDISRIVDFCTNSVPFSLGENNNQLQYFASFNSFFELRQILETMFASPLRLMVRIAIIMGCVLAASVFFLYCCCSAISTLDMAFFLFYCLLFILAMIFLAIVALSLIAESVVEILASFTSLVTRSLSTVLTGIGHLCQRKELESVNADLENELYLIRTPRAYNV